MSSVNDQKKVDNDDLATYLENENLCKLFDMLMTRTYTATNPAEEILNLLQLKQLKDLGFVPRKSVLDAGGLKTAVGKRAIVCADLTGCKSSSENFSSQAKLRTELLCKTIKALLPLNVRMLLLFYDFDHHKKVEEEKEKEGREEKSNKKEEAEAATKQFLEEKEKKGSEETPATTAETKIKKESDQCCDFPQLQFLSSLLTKDKVTFRTCATPAGLLGVDIGEQSHTEIFVLPNLVQLQACDLNPQAHVAFLAPLISYAEIFICDSLSHMFLQQSGVLTKMPRAIGEVALGVTASVEVKGMSNFLCGAVPHSSSSNPQSTTSSKSNNSPSVPMAIQHSMAYNQRALLLGDRDSLLQSSVLSDLQLPIPALANLTNLFDVIFLTGESARIWEEKGYHKTRTMIQKENVESKEKNSYEKIKTGHQPLSVSEALDFFNQEQMRSEGRFRVIHAQDQWIGKPHVAVHGKKKVLGNLEPLPKGGKYARMDLIGPSALQEFSENLSRCKTLLMIGAFGGIFPPVVSSQASPSKIPSTPSSGLQGKTSQEGIIAPGICQLLARLPLLKGSFTLLGSGSGAQPPTSSVGQTSSSSSTAIAANNFCSALCGEECHAVVRQYLQLLQQQNNSPGAMPSSLSSLMHFSLLRYPQLGELLAGHALEPFKNLPLPAPKKGQSVV